MAAKRELKRLAKDLLVVGGVDYDRRAAEAPLRPDPPLGSTAPGRAEVLGARLLAAAALLVALRFCWLARGYELVPSCNGLGFCCHFGGLLI